MCCSASAQGNAPKFLARVSKRGVPVNHGRQALPRVVLNYLLPHEALGLMALVATLNCHDLHGASGFAPRVVRRNRVQSLAPASNYLHRFRFDFCADAPLTDASVGNTAAGGLSSCLPLNAAPAVFAPPRGMA